MTQPNKSLEKTFLELAAIAEVHPHEDKVLAYIRNRLETAAVPYQQDQAGNIIGHIAGGTAEAIAIVGHVDIAAPLGGRKVVVESDVIKTDGTGLLGADDKAAVAMMLELADWVKARPGRPAHPVELIFTIGEEAGCVGAAALDISLASARHALVLDWTGGIDHIVTQSPAYFKIDVEYLGRTAHPAEWRTGKNAGTALIAAASQLKVGEYAPGVTCNIGIFEFGKARNQVPGRATLQAELRSFDPPAIEAAAAKVEQLFRTIAEKHGVEPKLSFVKDSPAYQLDQSGQLFANVSRALSRQNLKPVLEPTYGCFDGNVLAARGFEVIMLGAAYYNPHSPNEYLDRREFAQGFEFVKQIGLG